MNFHDLVQLLDANPRYDEVVCFARHLDPKDVAACVGTHHTLKQEKGRPRFGFAYGNVWRYLRIEETLGIVVLWSAEDPAGRDPEPGTAWVIDPGTRSLLQSLTAAREMPMQVPLGVWHTAMLRKVDGRLHRNLVLEWRKRVEATSFSALDWVTVDTANPFFRWVKDSLWADVPKPCPECGGKGHTIGSGILDGKACEACGNTGIAMTHPFPGADAHPAKLGGELCVEGTNLRVRDLLLSLLEWPVAAEAPARKLAADLHVDESLLRSCLRGLADWLKTRTWVDRHVQCEGCARRRTYKCAPPFDWDDDYAPRCKYCPCHDFRPAPVQDATSVEKRCGTCAERIAGKPWVCPHIAGLLNLDGPPWPDCRFWKPEEQGK